ncbi:hypothetical protein SLE2022_140580 [Rubroshorea leprosula]
MAIRWATSALRWFDFDLLSLRSSIFSVSSSFHWPQLSFSFGLSVVDDLVWPLVTAFESVALVSMLCFFFLFCGCTV